METLLGSFIGLLLVMRRRAVLNARLRQQNTTLLSKRAGQSNAPFPSIRIVPTVGFGLRGVG